MSVDAASIAPGSAATANSSSCGSRSSLATEAAVMKQFTIPPDISEAYGSSGYLGADERDSGLRRKATVHHRLHRASMTGYVAQEIANAALLRERKSSASAAADATMKKAVLVRIVHKEEVKAWPIGDDEDDDDYSNTTVMKAVLCVFPFELNGKVKRIFLELGFETLIHLVSHLKGSGCHIGR